MTEKKKGILARLLGRCEKSKGNCCNVKIVPKEQIKKETRASDQEADKSLN